MAGCPFTSLCPRPTFGSRSVDFVFVFDKQYFILCFVLFCTFCYLIYFQTRLHSRCYWGIWIIITKDVLPSCSIESFSLVQYYFRHPQQNCWALKMCHYPIILGCDTPRTRGGSTWIHAGLRVHSFGMWFRVFCNILAYTSCRYHFSCCTLLFSIWCVWPHIWHWIKRYSTSSAPWTAGNHPTNSSLDHQRNFPFVTSYFGTRRCLIYASKCLYRSTSLQASSKRGGKV